MTVHDDPWMLVIVVVFLLALGACIYGMGMGSW